MKTGRALMSLILLAAVPVLQAADVARSAGAAFRDCNDCPEMVVIPAGSFVMGETGEGGAVVIRILQAFALGRHEVTRAEFARFIAGSGYE
ncbi:MAG: SUMF1/EgtB/PvdO family nonheme iron enzyme, partial [Steroidobacteraceae bacterium]